MDEDFARFIDPPLDLYNNNRPCLEEHVEHGLFLTVELPLSLQPTAVEIQVHENMDEIIESPKGLIPVSQAEDDEYPILHDDSIDFYEN